MEDGSDTLLRSGLRRYAPPVLVMAVIIVLSVKSPPEKAFEFESSDKLFHFLGYAAVGLLWARSLAWKKRPAGVIVISTLICFVYGAFLEFVQYFLPERSTEMMDIASDVAGGLAGAALYVYLFMRGKRR